MAPAALHAVQPDDAPQRSRPSTVTEAAKSGDRRELLIALRTRIARSVQNRNTHPRDLAPLSRRLLEIAKEIEAIDAGERNDDIGTAAATPDEKWTAT